MKKKYKIKSLKPKVFRFKKGESWDGNEYHFFPKSLSFEALCEAVKEAERLKNER